MKPIYTYLFILSLGLISCEKIVDVKVNQTDPYLVVDAWLSRKPGDQVVRLTLTQPYFDNSSTPTVNDAQVRITDNDGIEYPFTGQGDGNYVYNSTDTFGIVGDTYSLEVLWEGNTYTSSTVLPRKVTIDSLLFNTDEPEKRFPGYYAEFFGTDPDGVGDAYWLKAWKNGKYLNRPSEIYVFDDETLSEEGGGGIPFISPIRDFPNPEEVDINNNEVPYYTLERTYPISEDGTITIFGSEARVTNDQIEILLDDGPGNEPIDGGIETIPLDGSPYSLNANTNSVFKSADSLFLELHTISTDAFFFLERLQEETDRPGGFGALFATPPSDLPSNIVCDDPEVPVAGFFNISSVSERGARISEELLRIDD